MAELKIIHEAKLDGKVVTDTNRFEQKTIELTDGVSYRVEDAVIADAYGNDVLWASGDGGFDTFELGMLISSHDIYLELRNDNGTADAVLVFVKANVPHYFGPDLGAVSGSEAIDGADLEDDTDYHTVDQIAVQRDAEDGEGDATVSLYLFA